jgi:plant 3beta-hydroxysteroid-4alpha-carboxylate 3-dehydrogenase
MARHLVAALLRSGEWRVRVTTDDLAPALVVLSPGETDGILSDALRLCLGWCQGRSQKKV